MTESRQRRILINCDDLGYHRTINQAIVEILSQGVIRSASIMAVAPYFDDAVEKLKSAGISKIGVHLTLNSEYQALPFSPLSSAKSLINRRGFFCPDIQEMREQAQIEDVALEFEQQISKVVHSGFSVTHLDGHLFCYEKDEGGTELFKAVEQLSFKHALPFRSYSESKLQIIKNINMIWDGYDSEEERFAYYRSLFKNHSNTLAELIIHPGIELAQMQLFSATASRRYYDYRFFTSKEFVELIEENHIRIVDWPEVSAEN